MTDDATSGRLNQNTAVRFVGGAVVTAWLAGSWWGLLFLPLGASHDGRINARFGLHVRNFIEHGLEGSYYLASMAPFSTVPYTHHPPLINLLHAAAASVLGQGEWQLHAIGYVAGLGTVAGLLWLARELDLGAVTSTMAMALVAATPMFWIYARLGLGVSIMVVLLALWHRNQRIGGGCRTLLTAGWLTAFSSWPGAAMVVLVSGLGMRHVQNRRTAVTLGVVGLSAVAVALTWAVTAGGMAELAQHGLARFHWRPPALLVENYRWFYQTLFPWWVRWLILPSLVVAVVDRRTRVAAVSVSVALAAWTLIAPDAAYVHDFWTYPLLVPVFLGVAVMLDRAAGLLDGSRIVIAGTVILVMAAVVGFERLSPYRDAYFRAPSDAGALVREVGPAPGQATAWVAEGVDPIPRWVSYYWDLPVIEVTADTVDSVGGAELVLIRLDRLPSWIANPDKIAQKGRYAIVTGAGLGNLGAD